MSQVKGTNAVAVIFVTLMSIIVTGLVLAFIGFVLWLVYQAIARIPEETGRLLLSISIPILGSAVLLAVQRSWEKHRDLTQRMRDKKEPLLDQMLERLFEVMDSGVRDKSPDHSKWRSVMMELNRQLIIWGSEHLIREYNAVLAKFRSSASADTSDKTRAIELMQEVERLFLAARRELGHSNRGLRRGDLLRIFIIEYPATN